MIYSSTYQYSINHAFLKKPFSNTLLLGSPEQFAVMVSPVIIILIVKKKRGRVKKDNEQSE